MWIYFFFGGGWKKGGWRLGVRCKVIDVQHFHIWYIILFYIYFNRPSLLSSVFFPMSRKSARVNFLFLKWHGMTRALFLIKNVRVLPCFKKKIEMFILSRALFHWHGHFHKWLTRGGEHCVLSDIKSLYIGFFFSNWITQGLKPFLSLEIRGWILILTNANVKKQHLSYTHKIKT